MPNTTNNSSPYFKLSQDEEDTSEDHDILVLSNPKSWKKYKSRFQYLAFLSISFNVLTFVVIILLLTKTNSIVPLAGGCQTLYSPAIDAIEYKTQIFHSSIHNDTTPYQGEPSPELDKMWDDLYSSGITTISKTEADQIINKTERILVGGEAQYVIQLGVFHQLHCLNMIRMALRPDYYSEDPYEFMSPDHLDHCLDSLRQAISCASDVTPFVWKWSEEHQAMKGRLNVAHSCRNFEKIRDWAVPRKVKGSMNMTYHVIDD